MARKRQSSRLDFFGLTLVSFQSVKKPNDDQQPNLIPHSLDRHRFGRKLSRDPAACF
jgi:hypothetical protein